MGGYVQMGSVRLDADDGTAHYWLRPIEAMTRMALLLGVHPTMRDTVAMPYWSSGSVVIETAFTSLIKVQCAAQGPAKSTAAT